MKKILLSISILNICVATPCGVKAAEQPTAQHQQSVSDGQRQLGISLEAFQKIDKRPRKISIRPRSLGNGIKTGLVIAYGHPFRPPYAVEARGYKIFVNDIQVVPSILDDREADRTKAVATPDSTALWNVSSQMQQKAQQGVNFDEILEFARRQSDIKSANAYSARSISLTSVDGSKLLVILPNKGATSLTDAQISEHSKVTQRNLAYRISSELHAGKCVIFVNGGLSEHVLSSTFPAIIPMIMENPALTDDTRFAELAKIRGTSVAADILANYEKSEWDSIRK